MLKKTGFLLVIMIALFLSCKLYAETYLIRAATPGMVGETSVSVVSDKTSFYKDESVTISWNISKVPSKIVINGYGEVSGQTGSVTYVPGVVSEITTTVFFGSGTVPVVTVIPISVGAYGASDIAFTSSSNNFYKNDPVTLNWTLPGTPSRIEAIGVGNLATTARSAVVKPGLVNELWLKVYYSDIATPITKKIAVTAIDYGVDDITLSAERRVFDTGINTRGYLAVTATKNPRKIVINPTVNCPYVYSGSGSGYAYTYNDRSCSLGKSFSRDTSNVVTGEVYFTPIKMAGILTVDVYYGSDPIPVTKTLSIMTPTESDINFTLSKTTFNYDEAITLSWNMANMAKPHTSMRAYIEGAYEGNRNIELSPTGNVGSMIITPGMRKKIIVQVYFVYPDSAMGMWVTKDIALNPVLAPLPGTLAAGYNCESIKAETGTATSGDYTVFVDNQVRAVTCDMVNNGGGWMLVTDYGYNSTKKALNLINANSCRAIRYQDGCSFAFSPSGADGLKITGSYEGALFYIDAGIGRKAMISMANDSDTGTQKIISTSSGSTLYSMSGITPYSLIVISKDDPSYKSFLIKTNDKTILIDEMWMKMY